MKPLALLFLLASPAHAWVPLPAESSGAVNANFLDLASEVRRGSIKNGGTVMQNVKFSSSIHVDGNAVFQASVGLSGAYLVGGGLWRQYVSSVTVGKHSLAGSIPNDDTIPQITEGDQILVATMTPVNANSKIIVRGTINIDEAPNNCNTGALCLFKGTGSNAIACVLVYTVGSPAYASVPISYVESATDTTQRNYSLRAGCEVANTLSVNRLAGTAKYGGTLTSILEVIEIEGR